MRDHERCPPFHQPLQLVAGVLRFLRRARWLVHPGSKSARFSAAHARWTAAGVPRRKAWLHAPQLPCRILRQTLDEGVRIGCFCRPGDFFQRRLRPSVSDIFRDRDGNGGSCKTSATWLRRLFSCTLRRSCPSTRTRPSDGSKNRATMPTSVVFPAPVAPAMATVSPGRTSREMVFKNGSPGV